MQFPFLHPTCRLWIVLLLVALILCCLHHKHPYLFIRTGTIDFVSLEISMYRVKACMPYLFFHGMKDFLQAFTASCVATAIRWLSPQMGTATFGDGVCFMAIHSPNRLTWVTGLIWSTYCPWHVPQMPAYSYSKMGLCGLQNGVIQRQGLLQKHTECSSMV